MGPRRRTCPSCFGGRKMKHIDDDDNDNHNPSSPSNVETSLMSEQKLSVLKDNNHARNNVKIFSYRELATATKNFRDESIIGEGGFGDVFMGKLKTTGQTVAVKKLNHQGKQGNKEFLVEVLMLSLLRHPNLVNLIGYCAEGDQRLLVYEYMPMGSLEDHLLDLEPDMEPLNWNTRMKIAASAAKGLNFLHNEADPPVIIRDLKPSNILLDEEFNPKLSDFGLAKFGPEDDRSHVSTRVMGTRGYCAPEYARTGKLTMQSDIYSFGVVMLVLITGRKALDETRGKGRHSLVDWARPMFRNDKNLVKLADPLLKGKFPEASFRKAMKIATTCLRDDAKSRPNMKDVVNALDYLTSHQRYTSGVAEEEQEGGESNDEEDNDENSEQIRLLDKQIQDRERAVAEAKRWGKTWRDRKQHTT